MPPTIDYEFGDLILVPFPLGDPGTTRKRPAVVVSSPAFQAQFGHLLILAVTSQPAGAAAGTLPVTAWKPAGLLGPSVIAPVLATMEASRVVRRLGKLRAEDRSSLESGLPALLGPGR